MIKEAEVLFGGNKHIVKYEINNQDIELISYSRYKNGVWVEEAFYSISKAKTLYRKVCKLERIKPL